MSARIVHVLCEGQTEHGFVEEVLKPYLIRNGVASVKSVLISTNRKLNARGGMLSFQQAARDLGLMMRVSVDGEYEKHVFTTMFDLYALPSDFPEYADAMKTADRYSRVDKLEQAFVQEINSVRFIPYIQLHEFEALVFCGINFLKDLYPDSDKGCKRLQEVLDKQPNPELVNDSPATAPSKRIIRAIEEESGTRYNYDKPKTGKYVTDKVGMEILREKCRHFSDWVGKLLG